MKCNCLSHYEVNSDVNRRRHLNCILRMFCSLLANQAHCYEGFSAFRQTSHPSNVFNGLS